MPPGCLLPVLLGLCVVGAVPAALMLHSMAHPYCAITRPSAVPSSNVSPKAVIARAHDGDGAVKLHPNHQVATGVDQEPLRRV